MKLFLGTPCTTWQVTPKTGHLGDRSVRYDDLNDLTSIDDLYGPGENFL